MSRRSHGKMTHDANRSAQRDREDSLRQLAASLRKERQKGSAEDTSPSSDCPDDGIE